MDAGRVPQCRRRDQSGRTSRGTGALDLASLHRPHAPDGRSLTA
jgi:hypothetical protein